MPGWTANVKPVSRVHENACAHAHAVCISAAGRVCAQCERARPRGICVRVRACVCMLACLVQPLCARGLLHRHVLW